MSRNEHIVQSSDALKLVRFILRQQKGTADIPTGIDWNAAPALARSHRISAPLFDAFDGTLSQHHGPPSSMTACHAALKRQVIAMSVRAHQMVEALGRVSETLTRADILHLAIRGPVLSQQLYGRPDFRRYDDLDILVPEALIEQAECVLMDACGYRHELVLREVERTAWRESGYGACLRAPDNTHTLDLYARIAPHYLKAGAHFDQLWTKRDEIHIDGLSIETTGRSETALLTLVHAAKHGWERACWLLDTCVLLEHMTRQETDRLMQLAEGWSVRRRLLIAIQLTRAMVAEAEEDGPGRAGSEAGVTARLVTETLERIAHRQGDADSPTPTRYILQSLDSQQDRCRFLLAKLFSPGIRDWREIELSGSARALYPIVRVLRLTKGLLGKF